ncbi:hypothetical protein [Alloprevotella tannerae]|uniref:hypothetical protein n=1 Tax=Alloprevotella tannerae TaxID=76122 RepID=UPI0028F04937|nr:hypothetical protein [Alloprevotella tannerae]
MRRLAAIRRQPIALLPGSRKLQQARPSAAKQLVRLRSRIGAVRVWREQTLVWRGQIIVWRGQIIAWWGQIIAWRGKIIA